MNTNNKKLIRRFNIKLLIILTILNANIKSFASVQNEIDKNISSEIQNFLKSKNKFNINQNNYYQHYIPFKSIEFHSDADQINNTTLKVKESSYALRFKMKSFEGYKFSKEIYNNNNNLLNLKNDILINESISNIYLNTINQLLLSYKKNILVISHEQLEKIKKLKNESENSFDEIKKMISAMKVENLSYEIEKIDSLLNTSFTKIEIKNIDSAVKTLSLRTPKLTLLLDTNLTNNSRIDVDQKVDELKLLIEKAEFNLKEKESTKFLNYIEMKHDPNDFETSFKLSFNIPFTQFDEYLKTSEVLNLKLKEEQQKINIEKKVKLRQIKIANLKQSSKGIIELNDKIDKVDRVLYKSRNNLPAKIQASLYELQQELKLDLSEMLESYFKIYFQLLVDFNLIVSHENDNLISENWSSFTFGEKH